MAFFAIAALAVSALAGNKARKESKKAGRASAEATRLQNLRERKNFLKEVRKARASALTQQVGSGSEVTSSGAQGVLASIQSQKTDTLSYLDRQQELGAEVAKRTENANKYNFYSGLASQAASIGQAVAPLIASNNTQPVPPTNINSSPFTRQ